MYLGHGAYGVEAASRLYFNKSNKQLTLEEAALIAGIFQTPERQSPFVDMKRATARRNVVLQRMADERYITQAQADAAKQKPIVTRGQPNQPPGIAPFFVEEVRKHLERSTARRCCTRTASSVHDDARRAAAGAGQPRARARPARATTSATAGASRSATSSPRGTPSTASRTIAGTRPIAVGDVVPAVVVTAPKTGRGAAADRRATTPTSREDGYAWTRRDVGGGPVQAGRSRRRRDHQARRGDRHGDGDARADAARRRRAARDRQPHRPDQGDGRRLELQPQQVQPRRAGVPAARLDLQADRLHRGDRSRLHAGVDPRSTRRSAIRRATARSTARTTTTTSSRARSRCATRSRSRATSRRSR